MKVFGKKRYNHLLAVITCFAFLSAIGCAHTPPYQQTGKYSEYIGEKAVRTALTMIGRPYKYRGESPSGFDCSGLVKFSYHAAGMDVPHGTQQLKNMTRTVSVRSMKKGDLLFFNENGKKYSHVGLYSGNGFFVHAPSSGQTVRQDSLQDDYWKKHFLEARRLQ